MSAEKTTARQCSRCGLAIEADQHGDLCAACAVIAAEDAVTSRSQSASLKEAAADKRHRRPIPTWLFVVVIAACMAFMVWRMPAFLQAVGGQAPARVGADTREGHCDACVANLWEYSAAMSRHAEMPHLMCPATGEPYSVTGNVEDGTLVVSCPTPDTHGLSSLRVKWDHRIPEAMK